MTDDATRERGIGGGSLLKVRGQLDRHALSGIGLVMPPAVQV